MNDSFVRSESALSWRFPATFWYANIAELFERAAFYGMFIAMAVYLTNVVGFTDVGAGYVGAYFTAVLYLLPPFMGAIADRIGFRFSLLLAFALLTMGYALLGAVPTKTAAVTALTLVLLGGAIVKPVITGTVVKCSDEAHRARAFSIFYWTVNIGAFSGKTVAAPLREHLGLQYINYYAALMAFIAFVWVALFYREVKSEATKSAKAILSGLIEVVGNFRFMALILIVAGFWLIQGQMYASMPKYVLRLVGEGAKPEWLANVNPFVVVLCVIPVTHMIRAVRPENAIGIALFLVTCSALVMSVGLYFQKTMGGSVSIVGNFAMHPVTIALVMGIALQGFAECFLSPKFLEYASRQAPPGEEGVYMGYQHLTNFFAWGIGFAMSGHLLDRYCPDPKTLSPEAHAQWTQALAGAGSMPVEYAHAHYLWYVYAGVGALAVLALCVFRWSTRDRVPAAA